MPVPTNYPIVVDSPFTFDLAGDVKRDADIDDELFEDVVFQSWDDKAEQRVQPKYAGIAHQVFLILLE